LNKGKAWFFVSATQKKKVCFHQIQVWWDESIEILGQQG
jgi:hypothetical protein